MEVTLPAGETGSALFYRVLKLAGLPLPRNSKAFKKTYADALVRFEAARVKSPERTAIACTLHEALLDSLRVGDRPLMQVLAEPVTPPGLITQDGERSLQLELPLDGKTYRGRELHQAIDKLFGDHHMTQAAASALHRAIDHDFDLRGHKFVLLGAGAELSPVRLLLAAGADVLWIDKTPPQGLVGKLTHTGGDDLLQHPQAALAAIRQFAAGEPVHMGLFCYAPGKGRELRLAGIMNALVLTLGTSLVRSVSMFISPTSPAEVQPEDLEVGRTRRWPLWQRALDMAHVLPRPGHYDGVARAIISLQGPAYQAAQYLAKICGGEALAAAGFRVSANVAGITNTKSLSHPLFQVAFKGAPAFGVRVFEPVTTRVLSGLLMLHDLHNTPVGVRQIHGGVYDLPWQFEQAVRVAAVRGLTMDLSLVMPKRVLKPT